jgi:hypothetical protein
MSDSLIMPLSKEELDRLREMVKSRLQFRDVILFGRLEFEVIQLRKRLAACNADTNVSEWHGQVTPTQPLKSRINWDGDTVQNIIQEVLDEVARHIRWTPPNPQQEATRFPTHKDVAEPACKNCGFTLDAHADGWCPNQIGGTRYRK